MIFYLISISIQNEQRFLLNIPYYKNLIFDIGYFYFPFAAIVIIGSSNAVNLTDGLDGLATVPLILVTLTFILIVYLSGNVVFAEYLKNYKYQKYIRGMHCFGSYGRILSWFFMV